MIGNYWNSAYRNLMKRKKFSFINVFGLAIGMASALLILTYVTFEFSFDKMHTKYPHIYRVQSTFREGEVLTDNWASSSFGYGSAMKENLAGIEDYTRIGSLLQPEQIVKYGELTLRENQIAYADPGFFRLFDFELLKGDKKTSLSMPGQVVITERIARKYFKVIGLEIYPVNSDEYAYLHSCGADYVTVFQETYNSDKYETLHLAGHKRIFPYRVNAQERALMGGMRGVGFGALLGLDDFRKDAFATGYHAYLLQRKYPHAEIAFSCPRLRPIINNDRINPMDVHEPQLLQVVCAYRLFMPFASITVSTRECARVRDNLVEIAATKISAGVSTGIGGHVDDIEDKGDDQFEISDGRSVDEVYHALLDHNLQPVMNDYIYV